MAKKGFTAILYKLVEPPAPWPSCRNPHTASFRAAGCADETYTAGGPAAKLRRPGEMYKTVNSVFFDSSDSSSSFDEEEQEEAALDDAFSASSDSEESSEAVIRSLGRAPTDRLFFDPGPTNAITRATPPEEEDGEPSLLEESVAVAVDSDDPYRDFRASMEEMAAAHGLRDWDGLEELLVWYLRINGKRNHALIVAAFVDLLVGLATTTTTSTSSNSSDGAATTTTTMEQCSNGKEPNDAPCSSASCVTFEEEEVGEKSSDYVSYYVSW